MIRLAIVVKGQTEERNVRTTTRSSWRHVFETPSPYSTPTVLEQAEVLSADWGGRHACDVFEASDCAREILPVDWVGRHVCAMWNDYQGFLIGGTVRLQK